ncbi:MAG: M20 family metallopeptidase [Longimicrobiales bacterium]|nr:M20 family metallopeptidase [Longimicrobiales bacterium]
MSEPTFDHAADPGELREGALRRLRRLVTLESPSDDEVRLRAIAADFSAELVGLGAKVETRDAPGVGEHVIGRLPGGDPTLQPVMILGHLDTVHAVGSFDPVFRVEDGRAYGPGTFDMKGGWACVLEALARLHAAGRTPRRPVLVVATCDEETGSETSRGLIEELARAADAVLVPEPPFPDGSAKTRRKGVSWYRLTAHGQASHAGLAPDEGVNAVVELAHQVLSITALADPGAGTTVSVDETAGGTASNVVPARAWAVIDVRFTGRAEAERIEAAMRSLEPVLPGARLELEGGINRPPMERTPGIAALYERARELAAEAGWPLGEGLSGGASDGSLTAGIGVPTLDGIGPVGHGAHAADEHVEVADLGRRAALYHRLLEVL